MYHFVFLSFGAAVLVISQRSTRFSIINYEYTVVVAAAVNLTIYGIFNHPWHDCTRTYRFADQASNC